MFYVVANFGLKSRGQCAAMRRGNPQAKGAVAFSTYILLPAGDRQLTFRFGFCAIFALGFLTGCAFVIAILTYCF